MRKKLTPENKAVLRLFGSASLEDTVVRLGFVAAYAVDPDFKRHVCRLRDSLAEWDSGLWTCFYLEEIRNLSITAYEVETCPACLEKKRSSSRDTQAVMMAARHGNASKKRIRRFGLDHSWRPRAKEGTNA